MSFLPTPGEGELDDEVRSTNAGAPEPAPAVRGIRAALQSHGPSFRAYLEWYALRDELVGVLGERAVYRFCLAIAEEARSEVCMAAFRDALLDLGVDSSPGDAPSVGAESDDGLLAEFGRLAVRAPDQVPSEVYSALEARFSGSERVQLVAFAGITVAVTVLASLGRVPLEAVGDALGRRHPHEAEIGMDALESGAE